MQNSANGMEVRRAGLGDKLLLESLLRYYVYDFSEFETADSDRLAFDGRGDFQINIHLDAYITDPNRWAYVIWFLGHPAGFAFINTVSHVGETIDRNMGEFFIARKYRRHGLATSAFHHLLTLHPGRWEVAVIEPNTGARKFWPKAIQAARKVSGFTQVHHDATAWKGPIWTFTITPE